MGKMQMPASSIFQDAVMSIVTDDSELQASVKRLARIEIAARYDGYCTMVHVQKLPIEGACDMKALAGFGERQMPLRRGCGLSGAIVRHANPSKAMHRW